MSRGTLIDQPRIKNDVSRRTMLVPVAYSESVMPALRLARSSRKIRRIARYLFVALVITIMFMAFAPWQQSVTGSGNVLAYSPDQRPQVIQAPRKGRIVRWREGMAPNLHVKKGDFICEIRDLDDSYLQRLESKLLNSEQAVAAAEVQLKGSEGALEAAKKIVESYEANVRAFESVRLSTIDAQDAYVKMAEQKVQAEKQQLAEYQAAIPQLEPELERVRTLQLEGNISLQKVQEVQRKFDEAQRKVDRAEAYLAAAQSELKGKMSERDAKVQEAIAKVDSAKAVLDKAKGDVRKAEGDIGKANEGLNKARKALLDSEVEVDRQKSQIIKAPFDGILVDIIPNLGTAIVKEANRICTIVPTSTDRSVEIWLDGNDAPLVEVGRHVRIQFEGWPALQFSGWPSVAVGTFGGDVASVDATPNEKGKFRVIIRPDLADDDDIPWPEERFLRQGARANGWVLLDQVPLWYEVWRRLNGFPPVVELEDTHKDNKPKTPKLPKSP